MGLYKRGRIWWMRFSFRGKQVIKSTKTRDKKLAERIYGKILNQIAEGKWFEQFDGNKTLGDLLDKYLKEHSTPNKSQKVAESDKKMVNEMNDFFGNVLLRNVTPRSVSDYKTGLREKGLSSSSINHRRTLLNHAFNLALKEWEWVKENPIARVKPEKASNARDKWLTPEEETLLIEKCILHPTVKDNKTEERYWLRDIVVFALNTGMRQDEILSLEWPHVDLFRKTAMVMKSKNGEKRTVPLSNTAFELLKAKSKVRSIKSNYVFISEAGTKILRRNLLRAFYNAVSRAKIEDFRFHDLRHTFATRLAQAGVDLYTVAKLLGHKDIRMTQRYSHHCSESLRRGVDVLDATAATLAAQQKGNTKLIQSNEKGATLNA